MLDIKFIRDNPKLVEEKAKQKGFPIDLKKLLTVDEKRKKLIEEVDHLRFCRGKLDLGAGEGNRYGRSAAAVNGRTARTAATGRAAATSPRSSRSRWQRSSDRSDRAAPGSPR